jgi:hypothetical protein
LRATLFLILGVGLAAVPFASCAESQDDVGASGGVSAGAAGLGGFDASAGSGGSAGVAASSGSGGTGGSVVDAPVDLPACDLQTADSTCATYPQCGCDSGQKCDVINFATGRAICSTAGSAQPYTPCFNPGLDCVAGSACVGLVCKPYCDTPADCPGANRHCLPVLYNNGTTSTPVPGMLTCTAGCDPINPGALCAPTLTCAFAQQSGPATDCFPAGTKTGIGECANNGSVCAPGYLCVNNAGSYDCLKWCRMGMSDCQSPQTCGGLQSQPTFNGVEYGVCL